MLFYHFLQKRLDFTTCSFFSLLGFGTITSRKKRSQDVKVFMHAGEPLFHCIQRRRFIAVRSSHDCRITFSERTVEYWIKDWWRLKKTLLSLLVTSSQEPVRIFRNRILDIRKFVKKDSFRSYTSYHLRVKFVVMHSWETRNFDEFALCMVVYLWIKHEPISLKNIMLRTQYLIANLISGQPSTSNLCINPCTEISNTTYRFWTKNTYESCSPGCHGTDYWHSMSADCSSSTQCDKGKTLEVETLSTLSIEIH